MTDLSLNPFAADGLQAEDRMVHYFDKLIEENELDWKIIHSVVSGAMHKYDTLHTITWVESAKVNAQKGDIRIYSCDDHGRPLADKEVCIDVKHSKNWGYASVSFPAKSSSVKTDAINHLCYFIGSGIAPDFWYMSIGSKGTIMFNLAEVQRFIGSCSEEELKMMCMRSMYNASPAWFLSFEHLVGRVKTWDLETWISEILQPRLG